MRIEIFIRIEKGERVRKGSQFKLLPGTDSIHEVVFGNRDLNQVFYPYLEPEYESSLFSRVGSFDLNTDRINIINLNKFLKHVNET